MGKPLLIALLIAGGVGGAIYWFSNRPVLYSDADGYSVELPAGWEGRRVGSQMAGNGPLTAGGVGTAMAAVYPYRTGQATRWPDEGKDSFMVPPEWSQPTEIGGARAVVATFLDGGFRYFGAAVDRGSSILVFRIGCPPEFFQKQRATFERAARSIRSTPPPAR